MRQRVYFENISNVIKSELLKACHTIKIAVAWIKDDTIIKVLEKKALEGVLIELLLVDDEINQNSSIHLNEQIQKHIIIYKIEESDVLMHNKFCIIDEKIIITGSYNWTNKAQTNFENIIVTDQKDTVISYNKEFQKLKEKLGLTPNSGTYNNVLGNYDTHLNLARSKAKQKLLAEACKDYIILLNYFPCQKEIYQELSIIQYQLKHYLGAIETWEKYQANFKDHIEACVQKIDLYKKLKDYNKAKSQIDIAISNYPSHYSYFIGSRADLWFIQIKVTKGTIQKTFEYYSNIASLKAHNEEERKYNIHFASLALEDYQKALNLDRNNETIKFKKLRIGELKFYLGEFHEARKIFEELFYNGYEYALQRYVYLLRDNEQYKNSIKYTRLLLGQCTNETDRWLLEKQIEDDQMHLTFWEKLF